MSGKFSAALSFILFASFAFAETKSLHYTLISPPAYTNEWQAYLDMRATQRPDVEFKLVNAMDIYAAHPIDPAATAGAPRNPAESIHAWIRHEMKDVATADRGKYYFVLGGSWAKAQGITSMDDVRLQTRIPNVYTQPRKAGNLDLIDDDPEQPCSDMFYACLDVPEGKWPWDGNGNGKYADSGELGNNQNDYYADVIIARIPVEKHPNATPRQVIAAFGAKVARAEAKEFSGAYHFAAAGGQVAKTFGISDGSTMREEREFYDGGINMFDPRHGGKWIDAEYLPRNTMKNMVAPTRPVLEGNPLLVYCWDANYPSVETATAHFFANDREFVEYRDHGSFQDLYCKYISVDNYLKAKGVARVIFSGFSCMTGHIDGDKLSLAEAEIESLEGGAVASTHNSRYGWGTNNVRIDDDGLSSTLQYYMKDEMINRDADIGTAWLRSRQRYSGRSGGTARFCMVEQLLLGDPLIKLSPSIPETTIEETTISVTNDCGYTILNVKGGTTISGEKLFKVMKKLNVTDGHALTFAADGGVGGSNVDFVNGEGKLTIASPKKSYFGQPTGADEVVIAGNGTTLDFDQAQPKFAKLTLEGGEGEVKNGNILRGRASGQLKSFLPLTIANTEVALGTVDAFGVVAGTLAKVNNGGLGITFNPNYGLKDSWEYLAGTIELDGGTLFSDRTETAGFGRPDMSSTLKVAVSGDSSVEARNGGKITLFGTTTFTLSEDASLTLDAAFVPDNATSGKIVITGGRSVVKDDSGLAGEVIVNDGTLVLNEIPLRNVTKLTLTGDSKLVIPMDEGGYSQILSAKGAVLDVSEATQVFELGKETTPISGKVSANGACFDLGKFKVWDGGNLTVAWVDGKKIYFPEIAAGGEIEVTVSEALTCSFIAFGNENGIYRFTGERLNLGSVVLSENVRFENDVYVATSTLVSGKESQFAKLITPSLQIQDGATVSATNIVNEIKTIKGVRFYPLKTNGGDGKSILLHELQFNAPSGKLPISSSTISYSECSVSNQGYLWDGVNEVVDAFAGISCSITASSTDDMAKGRVYLQFMFANDQSMITSYGLAASGNASNLAAKSLVSFRVDVTADGLNWVTVSEVKGATVPSGGGWYGRSATAFGIGSPASEISIASGGSLVLKGSATATIKLEAGAKLKAVSGSALTLGAGSRIELPSDGYAIIDVSDLTYEEVGEGLTILSGITLTQDHLDHLTTRGKPWLTPTIRDGSLVLVVDKKPAKVLFR